MGGGAGGTRGEVERARPRAGAGGKPRGTRHSPQPLCPVSPGVQRHLSQPGYGHGAQPSMPLWPSSGPGPMEEGPPRGASLSACPSLVVDVPPEAPSRPAWPCAALSTGPGPPGPVLAPLSPEHGYPPSWRTLLSSGHVLCSSAETLRGHRGAGGATPPTHLPWPGPEGPGWEPHTGEDAGRARRGRGQQDPLLPGSGSGVGTGSVMFQRPFWWSRGLSQGPPRPAPQAPSAPEPAELSRLGLSEGPSPGGPEPTPR